MATLYPELKETGRGYTLYYKGRYLYSVRDPKGRSEKVVGSIIIEKRTLLFIPSPLFFYGFDLLLTKLPQDCHILCIESDQNLMAASLDYSDKYYFAHKKISYIRTESPDQATAFVLNLGPWRFRRCQLIALSGGYSLYQKIYDQLHAAIEKEIRNYWQNKMTLIRMAELWIKNIFLNMPVLVRSRSFSRFHTEKAVFVAGAGESLEDALHFITALRDNLFVVAVDTALPILFASGIIPDLTCVVESQFINSKDFLDFKDSSIPVLADLTSYPNVLRLFKGDIYFFLS
ncbi:MAG: 6-hydroxymethylpterin diphosphokinase MptE-like protein, partial [Spirochaetota bacterium]